MVRTVAALLLVAISIPANAAPISGPISHYRDGDTFLIGNQPIRICGIDAPEKGSKAGTNATNYLKSITKGKAVKCIPVNEGTVCDGRSKRTNRDRIVAQCFVQGRDIAEMLVRSGNACDWSKFSGGAYRVVGGCAK